MDGLVHSLFKLFFWDVLFGEVAEGRVRVFGRIWVFPWFVGLIVLLSKDVFELVFAWMSKVVHWI